LAALKETTLLDNSFILVCFSVDLYFPFKFVGAFPDDFINGLFPLSKEIVVNVIYKEM
jgi:hypothetical protein